MEGRICRKCGLWKEWEEFSHNSDHFNNHNSRCKPCHREDCRDSIKRVKRRKFFRNKQRIEDWFEFWEVAIAGLVCTVLLIIFLYVNL